MTKKINNVSRQMKAKFFAEGHKLPTCINEGCDNYVQVREWKYWSFKSECSACAAARKKGIERPGVTKHKKNFCENHDAHLGFPCLVDHHKWIGSEYDFALDLDHLDGDHHNNIPENVRTYCKFCHGKKSLINGDCNSNKQSSRSID